MTYIFYVLNISLIRNVHKKQMSDSFTVSGKKKNAQLPFYWGLTYRYIFTIIYIFIYICIIYIYSLFTIFKVVAILTI